MRRSRLLASAGAILVGLGVITAPVNAAKLAKINGTPGDDVLVGTDADERLNGQAGNDSIDGGAGSDEVQAASGDDTAIYGFRENEGASDDYKGGSGFDRLVILIPDDVTAAVEVPMLQAAVDAFNAFLAATTGEGRRFYFAPFGFELTVRGFEDLETNLVAVDDGYVTVDPDLRFVVSPRLRKEFENGRAYYALEGEPLANLPDRLMDQPGREFIEWHNAEVYIG